MSKNDKDKDEIRLTVATPGITGPTAGEREGADTGGRDENPKVKDNNDGKGEKDEKGGKDGKSEKKSGFRTTLTRLFRGDFDQDDEQITGEVTLNKIFGGNILSAAFLQRQVLVIILIAVFIVLYISNRYSCQRSLGTIATLTRTLQEEKYKALSINSQLTEMTRESHVLEYLRTSKDSVLHIATQPPYIINVPEEENQQQ